MKTCEMIHVVPGLDGHGREQICDKPATCLLWGDTPACDACCHECMQDASHEEQAMIVWLEK